jgi:hypothetical protein
MNSRGAVHPLGVRRSTATSQAIEVAAGVEQKKSIDQQRSFNGAVNVRRNRDRMPANRTMQLGTENTTSSPMRFLRDSIRAVPAVKYALGIGGIVAAISIVDSFQVDPRVAALGTLVMLTLMSILVIFSRMASVSRREAIPPVLVLTWFSLLLFIAVSGTLFTCVFFGTPRDLSSWLTGAPEPRWPAGARIASDSEFVATLPLNTSFDEVRAFFDREGLRIRTIGTADEARAERAKLLDHSVAERTRYYADVRVRQRPEASVPKADGVASPRESLEVPCPNNMLIEGNSATVIKDDGGCYGPRILPNQTGASGMALQALETPSHGKRAVTCP